MSTTSTAVLHAPNQHPAIASGYLAAISLISIPLWVGFLGEIAASFHRGFRFPTEALTAAILYAFAVHCAIGGIRKSPLGSRIAAGLTLMGALVLPTFLHSIL